MMPDHVRIRVLAVDDHPVVRAGIAAMLASQAGIEVVAQAANGADAVALFEALTHSSSTLIEES
jgi:DNA-binding NarL/FixJ family response regulator